LDQTHTFLICEQAVGFGVHSDGRALGEAPDHESQGLWFLNQGRGRQCRAVHAAIVPAQPRAIEPVKCDKNGLKFDMRPGLC
jgi:hypothetical protein